MTFTMYAILLLATAAPAPVVPGAVERPVSLLSGCGARARGRAESFDHSAFDRLLHQHVAGGLVDYDSFKRSPEFAAYLGRLAVFDPSRLSDTDRLAFWINAYNAYTIALINEHAERGSIRNINKTLGWLKLKGPWSEPLAVVNGKHHTLDDIEHEIIRKRFHEPRIHFALVCAALGCPPLRSEAYLGSRLDEQLSDQARVFLLNSPAKNRVDMEHRVVYWSMIFNRYKEDFGGNDRAVGHFIAQFYTPGPERSLLESGAFNSAETSYDWRLNSSIGSR